MTHDDHQPLFCMQGLVSILEITDDKGDYSSPYQDLPPPLWLDDILPEGGSLSIEPFNGEGRNDVCGQNCYQFRAWYAELPNITMDELAHLARERGLVLSALSLVETDYDQQQLLDQNYQQQDVRDVLSFSKFRILRQSQAPSQSARDAIKVGAQGVIHLWAPQAFGDGFHATTFMCLQMLEYLDEVPDFSCAPFLDVGTGSGVLSLVAYALWQSHCVALDIEQDSVDALQENWARNHYPDESLSVFCGGDLSHQILNDHQKFDMVCVNMVKEPLLSYVPQVSVRQSKGQALILSGYLEEQRAEILSIAAKYGYVPNLERQKSQDGWACDLLFKK